MKCAESRIVICRPHATAASISVIAVLCPVVAQLAIALGAADRATLIEPQEILSDVAAMRSIVAVSTPTGVLPRGAQAGVVAKPSALPLRQIAVNRVSGDR